jgi:hypothetical protein
MHDVSNPGLPKVVACVRLISYCSFLQVLFSEEYTVSPAQIAAMATRDRAERRRTAFKKGIDPDDSRRWDQAKRGAMRA